MTGPESPVEQSLRPADPAAAVTPDEFDVEQPFDADGLHALRSTLAAHASSLGAPTEQIEQLVIVASELATNAIRHGGGSGQIRLWHRDRTLYCQVSDEGPGLSDLTVGQHLPPLQALTGRGMWIVRSIATALTIEPGRDARGVTITVTIAHPSDRPASPM
jgi:anti-sigma regulatory factor (Ser/Thr protein kinase)